MGSHLATMKITSLKCMEDLGRWEGLVFALSKVTESVNRGPVYLCTYSVRHSTFAV